jgi:hypothetical protein
MENPYQAPGNTQPGTTIRTYRDAGNLTFLVGLSLAGGALASIASIAAGLRQQQTFAQAQADGFTLDEAYAELGLEYFAIIVGQLGLLLASYVIIAMWIHRVASNTRCLVGPRYMDYTPAWAVGWYFIPIANLWKPYQAMKQVWTLNFARHPATPADAGLLLPLWWFLWLGWNIISNVAGRMSWRATTFEQEAAATIASVASDAANIPLCVVFFLITRRLHAAQQARSLAPRTPTLSIFPDRGPSPAPLTSGPSND